MSEIKRKIETVASLAGTGKYTVGLECEHYVTCSFDVTPLESHKEDDNLMVCPQCTKRGY
jgi:hypothetical protein